MIDARNFIDAVAEIVSRHRLDSGAYARWLWQNDVGDRDLGVNEYGCADAANILYSIGTFPAPERRQAWVDVLVPRQDPSTGLFREATHDPIHTTAHCLAALELFDARPLHALTALSGLRQPGAMEEFLDALDWRWNPWGESHKGAGVYAALLLAGEMSAETEDRYFGWLWDEADPETGLWRKGCVDSAPREFLFHHLAGSFHYLFNHEHARRPLRYPERMIDTCLRIHDERLFPPLGRSVGFAEIDWVYCLSRAVRQCGHRFAACRRALQGFAVDYVAHLTSLDPAADDGLNDLHQLFGSVCALAELQQAVPGLLRTRRPLRLVLDRRPFI